MAIVSPLPPTATHPALHNPTTINPMQRFCVIGDPIAHSRSPAIHTRFARLMGHSVEYTRLHVLADDASATLADMYRRGFSGCNVTLPHKGVAAAQAHRRSPAVELAQAANTLVFAADGFAAHNTDGVGLVRDISHNAGVQLAGARILLLGAGGAAAGALGALVDAQPARIDVVNRTPARAVELVGRHSDYAATAQVAVQAVDSLTADAVRGVAWDVVINATAASIAGQAAHKLFGLTAAQLADGALVYDMMYGDSAAVFLDWAAALRSDIQTRDGLGMLVEQAAQAYAIWLGDMPPGAQVLAEMRAGTL